MYSENEASSGFFYYSTTTHTHIHNLHFFFYSGRTRTSEKERKRETVESDDRHRNKRQNERERGRTEKETWTTRKKKNKVARELLQSKCMMMKMEPTNNAWDETKQMTASSSDPFFCFYSINICTLNFLLVTYICLLHV